MHHPEKSDWFISPTPFLPMCQPMSLSVMSAYSLTHPSVETRTKDEGESNQMQMASINERLETVMNETRGLERASCKGQKNTLGNPEEKMC